MSRVLLSWSSGKDSAWTLHELRARGQHEVVGLLTTVNRVHARVAMHAVREPLLERQAQAAGLPLWTIPIPSPCSNAEYESAFAGALARARAAGIEAIAFGDLFLEDVRAYRERTLRDSGLSPLFPLWGRPTAELARTMLCSGLRAVLTCVDPRQVDARLAGRAFDEALLAELPASADPCGERGEFHTFAWAGPMFVRPIPVRVTQVVERDGFAFADLVEDGAANAHE